MKEYDEISTHPLFIEALADAVRRPESDGVVQHLAALVEEGIPSTPSTSLEALDRNLIVGGGAAFLWEDVLTLGDVFDIVDSLIPGSSAGEAAKALLRLVCLMAKLRQVRVNLNVSEFQVMRAIKKGCDTRERVMKSTGLSDCDATIDALLTKTYKDDVFLVTEDDGKLSTVF